MVRYVMAAAALKLFSSSPRTKQVYRLLGNTIGQRGRIKQGLSREYVERAKKILEMCEKYRAIQNGDKLLEIGTGWLHWESTILRLFYDVEITLFDVWDNRQFGSYQRYLEQLDEVIDGELAMSALQHKRVHTLLRTIQRANSFDEVYDLLGFRYVVNPSGTLEKFQDHAFTVIFSSNVLEHVERSILPKFIRDFHRLLKPGGHSIHQIDLGDHLAYYDSSVSLKNYLRYSAKTWRRYFENDVQYFNLVQRPEWLDIFQEAGFELVEGETVPIDMGTIKIAKRYANLDKLDLQCRTLRVVHA
jgi:SAM-dependent methyltransferase